MARYGPGLCAFLLVACSGEPGDGGFSGTVEFPDVRVGSLVGGRVLEVLKAEGSAAAADEILIRLDPAEWEAHLDEASALAQATRKELDLLVAGPRPEEIARAEAEAKRLELLWTVMARGARPEEVAAAREDARAAEAQAADASQSYEREHELVATSASTAEALEKAGVARETSRARAEAARQRLRLLEAGFRPEEVEAARQSWVAAKSQADLVRAGARPEEIAARRATLEAAEARIRTAESRLRELTIRAPADAFVQTLDLRPGDLLAPGSAVAVLLVRERPTVTIHVPEDRLAAVTVGQKAEVRPDGHPPLAGEVTWVSRVAEFTPRNVQTPGERATQVFAAKIAVAGDTSRLKDGLWADVILK